MVLNHCFVRLLAGLAALAIIAMPAAAHADRKILRRSAVRIEYFVDGHGPVIVLLPSMGRSAEDFDEIVPLLVARGFRVVRPQPRGIGRSSGPTEGVTLHHLAADVASVIRKEYAMPAIVVGHAYGNFIARMIAVDHPALVRGVVVAAASARPVAPELLDALNRISDTSRPDAERLDLLRLAMFAPGNDPSGWLRGWHGEAQRVARAAIAATPTATWWSAGTAPILEIQPADDPFKPPAARGDLIAELGADRVSPVLIAHASHALFPEQPAAVANALAQWAARLPRPARR